MSLPTRHNSISRSRGLAHTQASFVGAMAIADLVKTTLGPKGMVRIATVRITGLA